MSRNWRRIASIITINIVLFFVFAELLALGVYFVNTGEIFYFSQKNTSAPAEETNYEELTYVRFHPFFGFMLKPGLEFQPTQLTLGPDRQFQLIDDKAYIRKTIQENPEWKNIKTNNYGFFSLYDYPVFKTNENQYIIGIFGGSVGERFSVQGKRRLIEKLKQNDFFKDKEIVILNFSSGGYKQPQQLQILTYFLSIGQEFDLVININGFNEVALSSINRYYNLDLAMPSGSHIIPLVDLTAQTTVAPNKLAALTRINSYKITLNRLAQRIDKSRLASVHLVLERYSNFIANRYYTELVKLQQLPSDPADISLIYVNRSQKDYDDVTRYRRIGEYSANAAVMMSQLLAEREVSYIDILQPNQYYSKHIFSDDEASIALSDASPYKPEIENGYPIYIEKFIEILKKNNLNTYSAIDIFDNELKNVYADNCCHYSQLGNEVMADFIASVILEGENIVSLNHR